MPRYPSPSKMRRKGKREKVRCAGHDCTFGGLIPCYPHACCRPATLYPRYCVAHSVAPTQPRGWRQMGSHTSPSQAGTNALDLWAGRQLPTWVYKRSIRWVKSLSSTIFCTDCHDSPGTVFAKLTNPCFRRRHQHFNLHERDKGSI